MGLRSEWIQLGAVNMAVDKPFDPEKVRQEYRQLPTMQKVATAVNDLARLAAGGATFGQMPRIAAAARGLGGEGTYEQRLAQEQRRDLEAGARAGFAGDIASVAGLGGGAKLAFQGIKQVPALAVKAAKSPAVRTIAGLGLGGYLQNVARTEAETAMADQAPAAQAPAAQAPVARAPAAQAPTSRPTTPKTEQGRIQSWMKEMGVTPQMTMRDMAALGQVMSQTVPKRTPMKDTILGEIYTIDASNLNRVMKDPSISLEDKEAYQQNFLQRYASLIGNSATFATPTTEE